MFFHSKWISQYFVLARDYIVGFPVLHSIYIYIYIYIYEWATTKQACRDELVVYVFFSSVYIYIWDESSPLAIAHAH